MRANRQCCARFLKPWHKGSPPSGTISSAVPSRLSRFRKPGSDGGTRFLSAERVGSRANFPRSSTPNRDTRVTPVSRRFVGGARRCCFINKIHRGPRLVSNHPKRNRQRERERERVWPGSHETNERVEEASGTGESGEKATITVTTLIQ